MICPRCKSDLIKKDVEGESIDVCMACNGMWLHKHQLNSLLMESGGDVEECSIDDNPHSDIYPNIECRECKGSIMKKINFLDYSEIIIDYCASCGAFWLDKDQLSNMHVYIKQVEDGSHDVKNISGYNLLVKLSQIAYLIFH